MLRRMLSVAIFMLVFSVMVNFAIEAGLRDEISLDDAAIAIDDGDVDFINVYRDDTDTMLSVQLRREGDIDAALLVPERLPGTGGSVAFDALVAAGAEPARIGDVNFRRLDERPPHHAQHQLQSVQLLARMVLLLTVAISLMVVLSDRLATTSGHLATDSR